MFALRWKNQIGGLTSLAYGLMWLASTIWHDHADCAPGCCETHSVAAVADGHCHDHAGQHHLHGDHCALHRHRAADDDLPDDSPAERCEPSHDYHACPFCEWWQHLLTAGLPAAPLVQAEAVGLLKALADPHWTFVVTFQPACRGPPAA